MHALFFYQAQREKGLDNNNNSILALKICILFIPYKGVVCMCVCVCDIEDTTHKQVEWCQNQPFGLWPCIHYLPLYLYYIHLFVCETLLFGFLSFVAQKISRGKCNSFLITNIFNFQIWDIYYFITKNLQLHVSVSACMSINLQ